MFVCLPYDLGLSIRVCAYNQIRRPAIQMAAHDFSKVYVTQLSTAMSNHVIGTPLAIEVLDYKKCPRCKKYMSQTDSMSRTDSMSQTGSMRCVPFQFK